MDNRHVGRYHAIFPGMFDAEGLAIMQAAGQLMRQHNDSEMLTEHLLFAISASDGPGASVLGTQKLNRLALQAKINNWVGDHPGEGYSGNVALGPRVVLVVNLARRYSAKAPINSYHLLMGLYAEEHGTAWRFLQEAGFKGDPYPNPASS
jgi:ATP-dependent Clp protease ATP-binding subunit ClpA